jgi:glycerophosphoryl diester phosphodiesterase
VVISFDLAGAHLARQLANLRFGWVISDISPLTALKCEAVAPDYLFCDHELLAKSTGRLWRGPWHWAIYEVTTRQLALELAARGAGFVETMAVRSLLREFREMEVP